MDTVSYTICRPDTGAVLPYAVVTVYKADGLTKAVIYNTVGTPIPSAVVTADIGGAISFQNDEPVYILSAISATGDYTVPPITINAPVRQSALTSTTPGAFGAGLSGMSSAGSGYPDGTVGAAIDRLRNAGLRLSEEYGDKGPGYDNTAAMAAFFNYLETMNGKKGGVISPWLSECASEINRSAVDWNGITLLGLSGLSGIKSTASYGVLKLGNISDVLIEGVSFTSSYSNSVEDGGKSLLYSYQKSVLRSAIRRCYFSNPNSFTSALTFYARINAADAGATINGLWIERNRFENVGRLAMTLMNRCTVAGGIADPAAAARNVYVRDNYAYNCGAQCPSYASAAAGYLNGMFISLDGDGQNVEVTGNYIERCQGIGIENVAWSDVLIANNVAKDFSKGLSFISNDDSAGVKFPKRVRIINNRAIGDLTNARNSNLYGLDATSTVEGNYLGSGTNSTQAALIRRAAGFKSAKNTYISTGAASIYAASVESGYFISDQDTFDNSASGTNNATLRFINAAATGSEVTNATILKGTGGSAYDQASGAAGNVVGPYKDSTGFLQNEYGTINNADADLTLTGAAAMTAYKGVRITGTLTAQRVINWPSRRGIPGEIWNSSNWPIQLQVNGVNGSIVNPNCRGAVVFDTSLNSLRFFGPDRAYQGSFTVATLPSAAGAGRGATAFVTDSAAAPAFGGTVTGGGSTAANVTSNGTSWVYG